MRGGIFALFTSSPGDEEPTVIGHGFGADGGTFVEPLAEPVPHEVAAADATAVAGRLFALERAGEVTVARSIADVDGALAEGAPPVAVLHMEGAEPIDPGLEALPAWYAAGLRSIGPVWSRANAFATGVQFVFPSSPDIGPGLTDAGVALVRACAEIGILIDLSHLNEKGFWDVARLEPGPLVASHSGAHARRPGLAQPDRRPARRDRRRAAAWSGSSTRPPSSAPTWPTTPTRRWRRSPPTPATSPTGSGSSTSASAPTSTAPRSPARSATSPACRSCSTPSARSASASAELEQIAWRNWRRVLDAWWR